MSKWTHAICPECMSREYPGLISLAGCEPPDEEDCCFCGVSTLSGIYVRHDPTQTPFCNHKDD